MAELPQRPETGQRRQARQRRQALVGRQVAETIRSRSIWWVVGTSLGFELVTLAAAAHIFCRRDY